MLIAAIILSYFVLTFLATIIFLGVEAGLRTDEWFFVFLFAIVPPVWLIGKLVYKIKSVVEHKRIIKRRKERGLPIDGVYRTDEDDED